MSRTSPALLVSNMGKIGRNLGLVLAMALLPMGAGCETTGPDAESEGELLGGTEVRVTVDPASQAFPDVSGELVVWEDHRRGNADIFLHDLSTGETRPLVTDTFDQRRPAISGGRVVWEDYRNGSSDLVVLDLQTGQTRVVADGPSSQRFPDLSGDLVVWEEARSGNTDV
ncbi:MAG: TolB family protein, partial [Gemmatimonadota bacterium]